MISNQIKEELDYYVREYNTVDFIAHDPISIPHQFTQKKDIEIAGFLTQIISWGKREQILKKSNNLMERMDYAPLEFIKDFSDSDLKRLHGWLYRTFQGDDLIYFLRQLKQIYNSHTDLESYFNTFINPSETHYSFAISRFKSDFFNQNPLPRTLKHLPDPYKGSSAKRFHMFLRWMVRQDNQEVDFGIWKSLDMSKLSCPLDVHSGRIGRHYHLITRKQNDFKALCELDANLRFLNPEDPSIYDFALFGIGVNQK